MNMKNWKNFFRVHGHSAGGFTLVELIVVIAILAILAGVAIPAYSGYIKKAQNAGDLQLLDAINTAFASACLANHTDINLIDTTKTAVVAPLVDGANGGKKLDVASMTPYQKDFAIFFAGNENAEFKGVTKIVFDPDLHMFVDAKNASKHQVIFFGQTFEILQSSIDAFKGSVFADNVKDMQSQLTGLATSFGQVVGDGALTELFGEEFNAFVEDLPADQRGNAAVLYVAQNSADMSARDVANLFATASESLPTDREPTIRDMLEAFPFEEGEDPLTNVALMYGAVTGFANSEACSDQTFKDRVGSVQDGEDLLAVFMELATPGSTVQNDWNGYLGTNDGGVVTPSENFAADMNGFLGAMDAINTVSPGINVGTENLWESEEVNNLLSDALDAN